MRRVGKNPKSQAKHKADTLLQKYIVKKYPKCECCGNPTSCGHHLVEKSRSNALRYDLTNIVPVCNVCHTQIHNMICGRMGNNILRSFNILEKIFLRRGKTPKGAQKWKDDLERRGRELIKTNISWYNDHITRLQKLLDDL